MKEKIGIGTIGVIVATEAEKLPFVEVFGEPDYIYDKEDFGYEVSTWSDYNNYKIHLMLSGYGEIAAASATQYLIDIFDVDGVINYGVVGGLHDDHFVQKVGIVKKIVHYGFDLSAGEYPVGRYPNQNDLFISPAKYVLPLAFLDKYPEFICASADKFVDAGEPKRKLRTEFGADICEMEAAAIVITCNRNGIPCSFIKAVSDGVDEGGEAFNLNVTLAAKACVEALVQFLA